MSIVRTSRKWLEAKHELTKKYPGLCISLKNQETVLVGIKNSTLEGDEVCLEEYECNYFNVTTPEEALKELIEAYGIKDVSNAFESLKTEFIRNTGIDLSTLKVKPYESSDSEYQRYNGQEFVLVREANFEEIDKDVAPMFVIKFRDGTECFAFSDEILSDESILGIFTPEFLKKYRPSDYEYELNKSK